MHALAGLKSATPLVGIERVDDLPVFPGAYALVMLAGQDIAVRRAGRSDRLPAGWYVYSGSAHGPGGVRARLKRHFRRDKALRWHVDQITVAAALMAAVPVPDGGECEVMKQLLAGGAMVPAMPGFGSTDCATCLSHLASLRSGTSKG